MYHVIIIEDDPMVASINKQYVEVTPEFRVDRIFKNGSEFLCLYTLFSACRIGYNVCIQGQ